MFITEITLNISSYVFLILHITKDLFKILKIKFDLLFLTTAQTHTLIKSHCTE